MKAEIFHKKELGSGIYTIPDIVYSTKIKFGKGQPDETIIPFIASTNGIMITKDLNIHKTLILKNFLRK